MRELVILCVEDEPEVRTVLVRDLEPFARAARIEETTDAAEAREVIATLATAGDQLGLVLCDHLLPGLRGVDFLVELQADPRTRAAKKVLVTGQAGLDDTIRALNEARIDHYIAKPWAVRDLRRIVRGLLTDFVIEHADDLLPYVRDLDGARILEALSERLDD